MNTNVASAVMDAKSRKEKENIYKEFERYDEKYSKYKSETNSGETTEENRCASYEKVDILIRAYIHVSYAIRYFNLRT